MNGGMTECGRCGFDSCVCDKQKIEISDIIDKLDDNYTTEYKMYFIRKGMLLAITRISDKISEIKPANIKLEDVEILERLVTAEKEILHVHRWWQFWKGGD